MFGSSWGTPQQNQPAQQATGAFGQPSTFGATNTTNAFGSTSAFGQPQQQQPAANPMFGNLNNTSTPAAPTTGFGGFGSTPAATTTNAFGAKPTTGFGAFGGTAAPATNNAFGSGTGAFGQPANTSTTGTGLFGQTPSTTGTTSAFGGASGGLFGNKGPAFGATGTTAHPTVTTGTSNPPYAAHTEKDGTTTQHFQAIVCMPAYAGYSFEELRVQDYAQGRKTASAAPGGFGSNAFGAPAAASQPSTGLFGAPQPSQTAFGAQPAAAPAANPFGGFGATNTTTTQSTNAFGGTGFGSTAQPAATNTFGSGGAFGTQTQPQQSTGLFGGTNTNNAFGGTASKPAFGGFGSTAAPTTTTNAFGGGGAFGQASQPAAPATTNLFGQPATQPAATNNAFGGFGATANKGLFGNTSTTPAAPTTTAPAFGGFGAQPAAQQNTTGGLFGQQQQQQPQQQAGGLFGQQQQQQPAQQGTGTGLFGSSANTTQQPAAGGGLFGGFGAQNTQQNTQQGSNLFGAPKPAAPAFGGFGQQQNTNTAQQTGGGLFGNTQNNTNTGFGGGLFGKPAAPAVGTNPSNGQTGGLFGSTLGTNNTFGATNAGAQQQSLTASIAQPIGSNLPIFNMLPPGPRLVDLDQSQVKKKSPFFVDVPTRSPIPRVPQQNFTPAASKLRGFGSSTATPPSQTGHNPFSSTVSFLQGKPGALALGDSRGSMGPDSFLGRSGSPALGSGSRQSVKKVILDKKVEPSQLFVKSGSPGPGGKVVFSPALSIAARESEAAAAAKNAANQHLDSSPTPAPRAAQKNATSKFTAKSNAKEKAGADPSELEEGDYWVKPDMASLKKLGYDELSAFKGLVVGRVGYGQIEFLEPVDLTGLSKLGALLGEVIHFEDKECSVYPDSEDVDKPPPGSGLNVKARLTLERCWALDKGTREPIKDEKHALVAKHLKRLKAMKDTKFVDFEMETGKWVFIVDHF